MSPLNINPLSLNRFRFSLDRCPNTTFFLEAISLPSVTLDQVDLHTPFHAMPLPGDTLQFGQLDIQCKWDENLAGWLDIWDWMEDIARRNVLGDTKGSPTPILEKLSDGVLEILNSSGKPIVEYKFEGMFPTTLSNGELSIAEDAPTIGRFTSSFGFSNMKVKPV